MTIEKADAHILKAVHEAYKFLENGIIPFSIHDLMVLKALAQRSLEHNQLEAWQISHFERIILKLERYIEDLEAKGDNV